MKTKSTLCILLISAQISFAQDGKLWLSFGAGISNTTSSNKNNLIGNGLNLQAEAFVPFYKKPNHFTLGINVAGNYTGLRNTTPNNADVASQYQVFNGNLSVASQSNGKTSGSFSGLMGLQGRISLGKFNVAPSLNAGYLRLDQKGFTQMGNATINGQTQEKELVKYEDKNTSGLIFKPQIKIGYNIAHNFTLFVGPAVVMGPELTHTTSYLVPQGGFNDRKMYEASQLAKGTWESKTTKSRYGLREVNFGISVALGKKKANVKPSGAVSPSYAKAAPVGSVAPTPNNATDFNTTRSNRERGQLKRPDTLHQEWDNMIAENLSKTSKNADTSTAGMVMKAGVSTSRSGIIRTGNAKLAENDNTNTNDTTWANQRLFMNVTTPKQTQGKTFGDSMANGLQTSPNTVGKSINEKGIKRNEAAAIAKPGQPISGIVVKGGKNPGGNLMITTTNDKGEFEFTVLEKGNYKFNFTIPAEAQDFNTTRSNRERGQDLAAKPGQPIGGIVVKGGKNPGGSSIITTANTNGEVVLNNLEVGNYLFQATAPTQPATKSINEKGVSSTKSRSRTEVLKSNKTEAVDGRTYTGGRKNEPQGKSINEKGVSASKPKPKAKQKTQVKESVKEKATSGLKDVVKTQV